MIDTHINDDFIISNSTCECKRAFSGAEVCANSFQYVCLGKKELNIVMVN